MKIVFAANYFTHHQEKLSLNLNKLSQNNYYYIASDQFPTERNQSGYIDLNKKYSFIIRPYENEEQSLLAEKVAFEADVLIIGSAPNRYLERRMRYNKLTFIYSERLFKKGLYRKYIPTTYKKIYDRYIKYKNKNLYIICSSSFTSFDLKLCGFDENKCYKWGYFPELYREEYSLIEKKKKNDVIEILWVARFIKLKNPNIVIETVNRIIKKGLSIHLTMIGDGPELKRSIQLSKKYNIDNYITFTKQVNVNMVFEYMKKANIFLFTSNKQEGWGAVLNEAMSCGCCVVAGDQIGSVPFLIKDGEDGIIYRTSDKDDLLNKVYKLCLNPRLCNEIGKKAYIKIHELWNVHVASQRLYFLFEELLKNNDTKKIFKTGPCSIAEIYKDNWYRR